MVVKATPSTAPQSPETDSNLRLQRTLDLQKKAVLDSDLVTAETRISRLNRCIDLLVDNTESIADAVNKDYGCRSIRQSKYAEVLFSLGPLKHARKNVRKWMKSRRRATLFPINLFGGRSKVVYQPLGVVGLIGPWNFPVHLIFAPLAGIFAAGNRCIMKPSELTPETSSLIADLVPNYFDEAELAVVTGGPEIGAHFCSLPFDHLMFTGGTNIGRHVMRAAADNLVPVTLELGGKSPVIVGDSAKIEQVAYACINGKTFNAGQICLSPDYVLISESRVQALVDSIQSMTDDSWPTMLNNPDYTSVINERHHARLVGYLQDAKAKGARIIEVNPAGEDFSDQSSHKMPLYLVLDVTDEMTIMQEEIFGPLLPIKTCSSVQQAVRYVNSQPHPLCLYYFGFDRTEQELIANQGVAGGITINDVFWHVGQEDLPFGGVGDSGMGAYHGFDGFKQFSHAKAVFRQAPVNVPKMLGIYPPYGEKFDKFLKSQIKK